MKSMFVSAGSDIGCRTRRKVCFNRWRDPRSMPPAAFFAVILRERRQSQGRTYRINESTRSESFACIVLGTSVFLLFSFSFSFHFSFYFPSEWTPISAIRNSYSDWASLREIHFPSSYFLIRVWLNLILLTSSIKYLQGSLYVRTMSMKLSYTWKLRPVIHHQMIPCAISLRKIEKELKEFTSLCCYISVSWPDADASWCTLIYLHGQMPDPCKP
jgi:hypothetical protein